MQRVLLALKSPLEVWQHPRVSPVIASFKYELEKRNLRPLNKPILREELLADGGWAGL